MLGALLVWLFAIRDEKPSDRGRERRSKACDLPGGGVRRGRLLLEIKDRRVLMEKWMGAGWMAAYEALHTGEIAKRSARVVAAQESSKRRPRCMLGRGGCEIYIVPSTNGLPGGL